MEIPEAPTKKAAKLKVFAAETFTTKTSETSAIFLHIKIKKVKDYFTSNTRKTYRENVAVSGSVFHVKMVINKGDQIVIRCKYQAGYASYY